MVAGLNEQTDPFVAAERGFIDGVIRPHSLRKRITRAFAALRGKKQDQPWKKHNTMPLRERGRCSRKSLSPIEAKSPAVSSKRQPVAGAPQHQGNGHGQQDGRDDLGDQQGSGIEGA